MSGSGGSKPTKLANGSAHGSKPIRYRVQFRKFALHSMAAAQMAYGFYSLSELALNAHVEHQYGDAMPPVTALITIGFGQFLTIIGLFASIIAMVLSSINDLLPSVPLMSRIKRGFMLFALPVEIVIASIYWPLVFLAPNLMFPPALPSEQQEEPSSQASSLLFRIPLSMDIRLHGLPTLALLLDFFVVEKKYHPPASTILAPLLALSFGIGYSIWVEHCATINGSFPYPFLNWMSLTERITLYVVSSLGALLAFRGLNWAHR